MQKLIQKILSSYQFAQLRFLFQKFYFRGNAVRYLAHRYNATWRNERALEVPLIWEMLNSFKAQNSDARVLELGNVLSHYYSIDHEVVDKYEKAHGVINKDITDFSPKKKYDLILGVSTLEHIGWDEVQKSPLKTIISVKKLQSLLNPGGMLILTFPHGHNPFLDFFIKYNLFKFTRTYFYKRMTFLNHWSPVSKKAFLETQYGLPYGNANGVCVAVYYKATD